MTAELVIPELIIRAIGEPARQGSKSYRGMRQSDLWITDET